MTLMSRPPIRHPLRTIGSFVVMLGSIAAIAFGPAARAQGCRADLDGDTEVGALDLASLLAASWPV